MRFHTDYDNRFFYINRGKLSDSLLKLYNNLTQIALLTDINNAILLLESIKFNIKE
jgi:hypothetical protein